MRARLAIAVRFAGSVAVLAIAWALGGPATAASGAEWPMYQHDLARTGFQPSDPLIDASSASSLSPNWTVMANDKISSQAIAANRLIYWGSWDGFEHATDPLTGIDRWQTYIGDETNPHCFGHLGVASTATVAPMEINGLQTMVLFVGGGAGSYYALDANTGQIIWETFFGSPQKGYFMWSSPALYNGSVYVGISSIDDCPLIPGELAKLNAVTGTVEAVFHTTPEGCVGGSIWSSPTVDEATGIVYATTGNGSCHRGIEPYAPAILQLTSDLSLIAAWRPPTIKLGNSDFGATPTLFSATIAGVSRELVGAANKNGKYYALDRTNFANGPVWQSKNIAKPSPNADVIASSAWDGSRLYVAGYLATISKQSCESTIRAIDPSTGRFVWSDCLSGGKALGAVTAAPGVVFEGLGSILYGVSSGTGEVLFRFEEPGQSKFYSPAMVSDGALYIGNSDGHFYRFTPAVP